MEKFTVMLMVSGTGEYSFLMQPVLHSCDKDDEQIIREVITTFVKNQKCSVIDMPNAIRKLRDEVWIVPIDGPNGKDIWTLGVQMSLTLPAVADGRISYPDDPGPQIPRAGSLWWCNGGHG